MPAPKQFSVPVGRAGLALESRMADLRIRLELIPPALLAERTGAPYLELGQGRGEFHFVFLGDSILLTYPDFRALNVGGESLPILKQVLLMYYFLTSNGSAPSRDWISFADLPEGRVYASAFQGYTGDAIAKTYALNLRLFQSACEALNGKPLSLGNASYSFQVLPRLQLVVVYHLGDDDFPSTCRILFPENTNHFLLTETCAILGSLLTQKLIRPKQPSA